MDESTGRTGGEQPVERFKPTNGMVVGWCGLALALLTIGYVLLAERSLLGLRLGFAAAFVGALVWSTQLRPRVTAYAEGLLMRGSISDVTVPYLAVDEVTMGQTLNVWAGGKRYVCIGIGKSLGFDTRQRIRSHGSGGSGGLLGTHRVSGMDTAPAGGSRRELGITYQSFVLDRIHDLVGAARLRGGSPSGQQPAVRTSYAVPEIVALVVTAAGLVVSLLL